MFELSLSCHCVKLTLEVLGVHSDGAYVVRFEQGPGTQTRSLDFPTSEHTWHHLNSGELILKLRDPPRPELL